MTAPASCVWNIVFRSLSLQIQRRPTSYFYVFNFCFCCNFHIVFLHTNKRHQHLHFLGEQISLQTELLDELKSGETLLRLANVLNRYKHRHGRQTTEKCSEVQPVRCLTYDMTFKVGLSETDAWMFQIISEKVK